MEKSDATEGKDTKRKGRWKDKVYSQQITEYANQTISPHEKGLYNSLFNSIVDDHKLDKPEELMMLDNAIYDFIRIKRLHKIIMEEGDMKEITLRNGSTIKKAHEASYLLNAIETQFRNNMKELLLTRREAVKKSLGVDSKDFASWLGENTVEVESGKDKKTN